MKKRSDTITLIYIRNKTGEPHSIEVSSKGAKLAVISIAVILLLSTLTSFLAVNLYFRNDRLADELSVLHDDKKALTEKILFMERALTDNYKKEKEVSGDRKEKADEEAKELEPQKMRIDGVKIGKAKEQNAFKLTYKVVNIYPSDDKITGYMIISCKRDYGYYTIPKDLNIVDDIPKTFKEGEPFSIRYFKPIEKTVPYPIDTVKSINVWLYDEEGSLILKRKVWER